VRVPHLAAMLRMEERGGLAIRALGVLLALLLPAGLTAGPTDVALAGTASQSSTYSWYISLAAQNAIDGNTDGDVYDGSVTHTNFDTNAWWQVQLTQLYDIESIVLWNRTDCCSDRLSNFMVSVYDGTTVVWSADFYTGGGYPDPSLSITLPAGTVGDEVRVSLNGTNYLSLAEVQVFSNGTAVPEPGTMALAGLGMMGLAAAFRRRH